MEHPLHRASCRDLHELVKSLPEDAWRQVSCLKARPGFRCQSERHPALPQAAANSLHRRHPLFSSPAVLPYLRQQQRAHAAIRDRMSWRERQLPVPHGWVLSPDLR